MGSTNATRRERTGEGMKGIRIGAVVALLMTTACSSARPVLYPNAQLQSVGKEAAEQDIEACKQSAESAGADAVSLVNTLVGMAIDVRKRKPLLANQTGGLSGPAIKPVAVRMVYQVAAAVEVPVIGMGGIMSLNDALEFFMAGASAIQIGTAIFVDPGLPIRLIDELGAWLEGEGFPSLAQVVGIANPGFRAGVAPALAVET